MWVDVVMSERFRSAESGAGPAEAWSPDAGFAARVDRLLTDAGGGAQLNSVVARAAIQGPIPGRVCVDGQWGMGPWLQAALGAGC